MHNIQTTIKRFLSQLADLIRPLSLSRAAVSKLLGHIRRILSMECQSLADRLATVKALVMRLVERLGARRTKAARTTKPHVPATKNVSAQAVALREFVLSSYRLRCNHPGINHRGVPLVLRGGRGRRSPNNCRSPVSCSDILGLLPNRLACSFV